MLVNSQNYFEYINKIGAINLSAPIKKMHDLIVRLTDEGTNWKSYQTYKPQIDKQFEAIELVWKARNKAPDKQSKPQPQKEAVIQEHPRKQTGNSSVKKVQVAKNEIPKIKGKEVELISPEVTFIKRFALLQNKEKNRQQVLSFIKALQKAVIERKIRKTSKYANVIAFIQKQLVNTYNSMGESVGFNFTHSDYVKYLKMAGAEYLMPSVRFIKSYIGMLGQTITKEKASRLFDKIALAFDNKVIPNTDKYIKHVRMIFASLDKFIKTGNVPNISEAQLNGLQGVLADCGCNLHGSSYQETYGSSLDGVEEENKEDEVPEANVQSPGVMNVEQAKQLKFNAIGLKDKYLKLIGNACKPTDIFVYGLGGGGKTSFVLLLSQELDRLGYKVLYIAGEQFNTPTFTELLNRLNINVGENFKIVKSLKTLNPGNFDFVVLDSKDQMEIDVDDFIKLKKRYPLQSFIILSQATKDGNFTGTERWRNIVDIMVYADNGVIKTGMDKNRWGGAGELKIFE